MVSIRFVVKTAVAFALVLGLAWVMTSPVVCFGCGGIEFPDDTTEAEKQAIADDMKNVVSTLVTATVILVTLLFAAYTAFRPRDEGDGHG